MSVKLIAETSVEEYDKYFDNEYGEGNFDYHLSLVSRFDNQKIVGKATTKKEAIEEARIALLESLQDNQQCKAGSCFDSYYIYSHKFSLGLFSNRYTLTKKKDKLRQISTAA